MEQTLAIDKATKLKTKPGFVPTSTAAMLVAPKAPTMI